ncbi:MAG TPA: hypothetical protein VJ913_10705 [Actinomycetota bacterium]|nr:hypothetical protein [Actinomycetota bacterium]
MGSRPGVPALALVLSGSLGLSVVQVTAALEVALGVGLGLAAFAVVRRGGVAGATLAGLLAGTFGVHLAAGYLSNLAMAAAFVAAIALLDRRTNRAALVAGLVLAGSGLAHPQFFLVGVVILGVAAVLARRSDRDEAFRIAGAALGGGAVLGAGLLAVQVGPAPPDVDTSRDAFLRRAGLLSELRSAYFDRFVHRWTRYVQWLSVPLAVVGFGSPNGTAGRVLRSWFVITFVGIALALVTGWLPADRFITFGFAVPILAALGVIRMWRWLQPRRAAAVLVTAAMTIAMLAGSWIAWNRQEPFLSEEEVTAVRTANETFATLPEGTPLAFWVNEPDSSVSFLATLAGNVIRAGVPTDRIRDVVVVVPPGGSGPERRALTRLTFRDVDSAQDESERTATVFVLEPFDAVDSPEGAVVIDLPVKDMFGVDPLEPLTRLGVTVASFAILTMLGIAGYGWARIGIDGVLTAAAAAPAVGAAMLILAAVALDIVGVAIGEPPGAVAALSLGGGGGYLARFVLERRARTRPAPQVQEQPAE